MATSYFKQSNNSKRALVLSGGGARGSFEIGVWKGLNELGFFPDIVTGISVGALNGALIVQGNYEKAEMMWKEVQTQHILDYDFPLEMKSFKDYRRTMTGFIIEAIFKKGIGTEPLKQLINEYLTSEKELRQKEIDFGLVVTNYETKERLSFYLDELKEGQLGDLLLASTSLYPAMKKAYINGVPYVDGGYENHIPLQLALERNPDEIVIVDLQPERGLSSPIPKKYQGKNIIVVTSEWYLGDLLVFDQSRNHLNIALGYNEVMKVSGKYTGHLYTFESTYTDKEFKDFYLALNRLLTGQSFKTLNEFINQKNNQMDLVNAVSEMWGKPFDDKAFPFAVLEVTAKLFRVDPGETYSISTLQEKIIEAFSNYVEVDKELPEEFIPDYNFGIEEWKEYFTNNFSLLSNRKTVKYMLMLLRDNFTDLTKLKYQILFKLKPLPLVVALYLYYLIDKMKD